jgi:hypothetical protein
MVAMVRCLVGTEKGKYLLDPPFFGQLIRWTGREKWAYRYSSRELAQEDVDFTWGAGTKLVEVDDERQAQSKMDLRTDFRGAAAS